jgi:hypothetical protein
MGIDLGIIVANRIEGGALIYFWKGIFFVALGGTTLAASGSRLR